jgi:hypothetical protein
MSGVLLQALDFVRPIPAFHAGDRGSNPLGDAKGIQRVRIHFLALCCYLVAPHGSPFPKEGSW